MKPPQLLLMAILAMPQCGCLGLVAGVATFVGAIGPRKQRRLHIDYDCGVSLGSALDYTYKLTDDHVPPEDLLHKELEFSSGIRHSLRLAVSVERGDNDRSSCLIGYTRQDRDSTMDGATRPSREDAWYIGGEVARGRGESPTFLFARFVGGLGEIVIEQSVATPPWPSAEAPGMRMRYAQLAGGVGYRPLPWGELRAGVALDMIALPHPGGHMNDTILGNDNADKTIAAFVSLSLHHQF